MIWIKELAAKWGPLACAARTSSTASGVCATGPARPKPPLLPRDGASSAAALWFEIILIGQTIRQKFLTISERMRAYVPGFPEHIGGGPCRPRKGPHRGSEQACGLLFGG